MTENLNASGQLQKELTLLGDSDRGSGSDIELPGYDPGVRSGGLLARNKVRRLSPSRPGSSEVAEALPCGLPRRAQSRADPDGSPLLLVVDA